MPSSDEPAATPRHVYSSSRIAAAPCGDVVERRVRSGRSVAGIRVGSRARCPRAVRGVPSPDVFSCPHIALTCRSVDPEDNKVTLALDADLVARVRDAFGPSDASDAALVERALKAYQLIRGKRLAALDELTALSEELGCR